jgi:hypothetical protein
MASRRMPKQQLYALWCQSPRLVASAELWRILAMLKERHGSNWAHSLPTSPAAILAMIVTRRWR